MGGGRLFSQRCGYAVHALAYVANLPAGRLATLGQMADWMRSIWPAVSEPYLSSVVQRLARGGLLRSLRGISGGYVLGRPAEEITLRDVVELLDGVFGDGNRCGLSLEDRCPAQSRCAIQRRLALIERQFLESLQAVTIAELAQQVVIPRKVKGV